MSDGPIDTAAAEAATNATTSFQPMPPIYSPIIVNERVFVTWYEQSETGDGDDYQFLSEPRHVELSPEQVEQFNDLFNQQMDKMSALLETFVKGDGLPDCADPQAPVQRECPNCGAFKPDPTSTCEYCNGKAFV